MSDYPNDQDGEVLQMLADNGVDMDEPLEFEFIVAALDEATAIKCEKAIQAAGYETEVVYDEGELEYGEIPTDDNQDLWPSWSVYAIVNMLPSYDEIIRIQEELDELAQPFECFADGWGVAQPA